MLDLLMTISSGFVIGLIARALVPGDQSAGFWLTTLLGVLGAFLGNFINATLLHVNQAAGVLMSSLSAAVLLYCWSKFLNS
jgi:uncharacterized membrane protein YeaQ/YmgE (transglycosylase-associated protein family)